MRAFCFSAIRNKQRNKHLLLRITITCRDTVMSWIDKAQSLMEQAWLGTVMGIVSIVVAAITYMWARKRTSLGYVHLGEHLLGSTSDALPDAISVQYDGISIPRLTKTILIIWNNGENTVSGSDIVTKDPLRLQVGDDGRILSISVLKSSRAVNDFRIILAPDEVTNKAQLTFDFLDAKDGVAVEILHTSTDRRPSIKGTLKGLPQGFSNLGQFTRPKPRKKPKSGTLSILRTVAFSPIVLACTGFLVAVYGPRPSFTPELVSMSPFLSGLLGGVVFAWASRAFSSRRKYPKSLHLEALE